jgi:CRP-like cAMP-binding protein
VQRNRNRLLASLKSEDLALLRRHLREVSMEQGELLEERGRRADAVYFPQSGMVSLIVETPEDQTVEVAVIGSESAVGITVGLGSRISMVTAMVQVSGTSFCISASQFRAAAAQSQNIRDLIVRYHEMLMGQIQQTAACNALHDVGSRLARWLLQTSDRIDSNTIPFTREFLGKMLGVSRGTVSAVASKFEEAGIIQTRRGQIKVLDRERLKKESCSCYDFIRKHIDRLVPRQ